MRGLSRFLLAAALTACPFGSAFAYTGYIKAQSFNTSGDRVAIESAFARQFFTPEVALYSQQLHAVGPDGSAIVFTGVQVTGPTAALVLQTFDPGTYRISTGDQLGAVTNLVGADGQWRPLGAGELVPEGAQTTTLQTVTLAEAYVSRGQPTTATLAAPGGSLAIRPITHPNQVLAAQGFDVELQFNGAPFPGMPLVLYGAGVSETTMDKVFVTDAAGRAHVSFDAPGTYVLAVRHRVNAPEGAPAQVRSYTTTLTFEAMTALPDYPPPPPPARRRARTRTG